MKYAIGDIITGVISGVKAYGVFIKFEDTFGFCHISNCSHKFIKNLNDWFPIGSEITAKIIDVDDEHGRVNVSIKDCEIQKPKIEKSKNEFKKSSQEEISKTIESKPSFDDMLKTYLKNSEERLDSIGKRNHKHRKR